jgi:hypothetical protein
MKNIFIGGSQLKSDEKSYANETIWLAVDILRFILEQIFLQIKIISRWRENFGIFT